MEAHKTFLDQMGRSLTIPFPPKRIVSLCPSQTETLIALGLENEVVGRTRFCIHPEDKVQNILSVGGTKGIKMDRLRSLRPDLIIGEKEENTPEMIAGIEAEFPVFMTDVKGIASALEMIWLLGEISGKQSRAMRLRQEVESGLGRVKALDRPLRSAYLIWEDPCMAVGSDTFIHSMMQLCGFDNLFAGRAERYPKISHQELLEFRPDLLLLSSEPFPYKEKHMEFYRNLLPRARIELIDGEKFSWYGSHLLKTPEYLNSLLKNLAEEKK